MKDKFEGKIIGFSDRKEIKPAEDKPIEINNHLVEVLEELMNDALNGDLKDCVIVARHEECKSFHPIISTARNFMPDMYYMLDKMKAIYEESFYIDEE